MPKETCKFYVEYEEPTVDNVDDVIDSDAKSLLELDHVPGEIVAAKTDNVLKFMAYSSQKKGLSGVLYCTNYRLCFVTSERDNSRNMLIGVHDVSLANVNVIYQVFSDKTRRKLTKVESGTFLDTTGLVVYAKDFSIHSYDFKFSKKEEIKILVNTLVQMSFPRDHSLLFAHTFASSLPNESFKRASAISSTFCMPLMFANHEDWHYELARQGATTDWRVTHVNADYHVSQSLPKYFVVPSSVADDNIRRWASHYQGNRMPVWCYSTKSGCFLVRSSALRSERLLTPFERQKKNRFMEELRRIRQETKHKPMEVPLSSILPSVVDLQASYEKLSAICAPETAADFVKTDANFFSELESSRWLEHVNTVLWRCDQIANYMGIGHSIILQEDGGRDMTCIVSCLVQLILDEGSRSISGFQQLVQREWVAMGHEFSKRVGLVHDKEYQPSPVFLLFLECVWRLTLTYPASFGFTDVYLVSLWDSVLLGLFKEFVYNCEHQRWQKQQVGLLDRSAEASEEECLPSVWRWQLQYHAEDMLDFINPLYQLPRLRQNDNSKNERLMYDSKLPPQQLVWHTCYYRWLSPVQILNGGEPAAFFRKCVLVQEAATASVRLSSSDSTDSGCRLYGVLPDIDSSAAMSGLAKSNSVLTSNYPFIKQSLRYNDETGHFSSERSASLSSLLEKSSELDWMRDDNIDD